MLTLDPFLTAATLAFLLELAGLATTAFLEDKIMEFIVVVVVVFVEFKFARSDLVDELSGFL